MIPILVQKTTYSDLDATLELHNEIFEENDKLESIFIFEIPIKLKAEESGRIVGSLYAYQNCDKYLIGNIIVDNSKHNAKRIVEELITYLVTQAMKNNLKHIYIEKRAGIIPQEIYKCLNFEEIRAERKFYGKTYVVMSKNIVSRIRIKKNFLE